jgi:hypothetical protein
VITVYAYWECDGTPVEHAEITVNKKGFFGSGMLTEFTDTYGKVNFDTDLGPGQVFIGNKEVYNDELQSMMTFYKDIVGFFGGERWIMR